MKKSFGLFQNLKASLGKISMILCLLVAMTNRINAQGLYTHTQHTTTVSDISPMPHLTSNPSHGAITEPFVQLASFHLVYTDRDVMIKWSTATETNHLGFEVQYSKDGLRWISLGFITGNGNSTKPKFYQFNHKGSPNKNFQYRLKQFNAAKEIIFSKTLTLL